jgi:polyphosphate kinase 2 (PPK2 family)
MYAHNRYGVLICLQGMDTSGQFDSWSFKDLIPEVLLCTVLNTYSKELEHDYLWRHYLALPEKENLPF